MPILGSIDSATFANNVAVTNDSATVTRNAADAIVGGDVIVLANVSYYVKSVDGTTVTLAKKYAGATNGTLAGAKRRTAPKALSDFVLTRAADHQSSVDTQIVAVSLAEAQLSTNKSRGISSPGWWAYRTYTDASGTTRHKSELIASYKDGSAISGDFTDDLVAGDAASAVSISTQPANASVEADGSNTATFSVTAAKTGAGSLTYQWQISTDEGASFSDISSANAASHETAAVVAGDDQNQYRVKVGTDAGAIELVLSAATLTVT